MQDSKRNILPWRASGYADVRSKVLDNNQNIGEVVEVNDTHALIQWDYGKFAYPLLSIRVVEGDLWSINPQSARVYLDEVAG